VTKIQNIHHCWWTRI